MKKDLGMRVYRSHLLQAMNKDDPDRHMEFCKWHQNCIDADPDFYWAVLGSDEAIFKLNGHINGHNCVYWATKNPHLVIQEQLNVPGIMIWAGICAHTIVGPYYFEGGKVIDALYLELLQQLCLPCVMRMMQ